jgi:type I restriction enzyme S subunit
MQRYESYKPSGVEWLGDIPCHWEIKQLRWLADFVERGTAPTYADNGMLVINQACLSTYELNLSKAKYHQSKEDVRNFRGFLKKGDILIASTGRGVLGKCCFVNSEIEGFVDSHVSIVRDSKDRLPAKFVFYLLSTQYEMINACLSQGSTNQTELQRDSFRKLPIPLPPRAEQDSIVMFLDQKTAEIDTAIAKKKRLIELLQEQKSILINQAVTRGLNPDVAMRDSGVDWIGEIPAHWFVIPNSYVFREQNMRSIKGEETHLSMSQRYGLVPAKNLETKTLQSESYDGAKLCKAGDLVQNRLKAHLAVFSVASCDGLVSPDYSVFRLQDRKNHPLFFERLYKTPIYLSEFNRRVRGIVVGFLRLYSDDFNAIPALVPPHIEQEYIVRYIIKLNSEFGIMQEKVETEISKLVDLKVIIVADAITGKIRV